MRSSLADRTVVAPVTVHLVRVRRRRFGARVDDPSRPGMGTQNELNSVRPVSAPWTSYVAPGSATNRIGIGELEKASAARA
jgi:hypothetical protein